MPNKNYNTSEVRAKPKEKRLPMKGFIPAQKLREQIRAKREEEHKRMLDKAWRGIELDRIRAIEKLKVKKKKKKLEEPPRIQQLRKDIARMKTLLNSKKKPSPHHHRPELVIPRR